MLILETIIVALWVFFMGVGYGYFRHLFGELKFSWTPANRMSCAALCLAGPAAVICALVVDFARPILA